MDLDKIEKRIYDLYHEFTNRCLAGKRVYNTQRSQLEKIWHFVNPDIQEYWQAELEKVFGDNEPWLQFVNKKFKKGDNEFVCVNGVNDSNI